LAVRGIKISNLPLSVKNFSLNVDIKQECIFDELKSMLGIRIPIMLDPDLFGQIYIFERAMSVRSAIFQPQSKIESVL
jgi:hypothetical protein